MARYAVKLDGQGAKPIIVRSGIEAGIRADFMSPSLETRVQWGGPGGDALTIWAREPKPLGAPDNGDGWELVTVVTKQHRDPRRGEYIPAYRIPVAARQ